MKVAEVRTQIYLSREQHRELQRAADMRSVSMAKVIRDALAEYLDRQPETEPAPRRDAAFGLLDEAARIGGSGLAEADASRLDDELYGPIEG
jgi:hypothetical protein